MGSQRRSSSAEAGFQLVELAVVLVILGLVLAAATPSFTRRNEWNRLEGTGREFSARVAQARQKAVTQRVPFRLTMNVSDASYRFERQQNDSTWSRDPDRSFTPAGVAEVLAEIDGSSVLDSLQIVFEPRGTVRAEDVPARFRFVNVREDTADVSLVRTGRVIIRMSAAED